MCRLSSSQYDDLYRRTSLEAGRSLLGWLRGLWRARRPQVAEAKVVPFRAWRRPLTRKPPARTSKAA